MSSATLNAHDSSRYESPASGSWFDGIVREIGQAFNPTLALVNHSCDPNSIHYNLARASVSVALRNIAKGLEGAAGHTNCHRTNFADLKTLIVECYYGFYGGTSKMTRQNILSEKFRFKCACEACTWDWPTMQDMGTDSMKKGISMSIPERLQVVQANNKAINGFINAIQRQKIAEEYERILKILSDFNKHLQDTVQLPSKQIVRNTQDFYKCLWILRGSRIKVET